MSEVDDLVERLDACIEEDSDGTLRLALREPVSTGGGGTRKTLAVRRVTLADMRAFSKADGDFAVLVDRLVDPPELHLKITTEWDGLVLTRAAARQLEKYQRSGR